MRKIADESAVCEKRDRGQVLDRGFEAEAWLGDVLLPIPRHLVYLFLGGLGPPSEGQINIVLDRDSAVSAFWQFPFLPKLIILYLQIIFLQFAQPGLGQFLFKETKCIPLIQPADIGWPTGNRKKISCCQAQLR